MHFYKENREKKEEEKNYNKNVKEKKHFFLQMVTFKRCNLYFEVSYTRECTHSNEQIKHAKCCDNEEKKERCITEKQKRIEKNRFVCRCFW